MEMGRATYAGAMTIWLDNAHKIQIQAKEKDGSQKEEETWEQKDLVKMEDSANMEDLEKVRRAKARRMNLLHNHKSGGANGQVKMIGPKVPDQHHWLR